MKKKKILIATSSFAINDKNPINRLKKCGFELIINPYKRKLSQKELKNFVKDKSLFGVIAGLETYDENILKNSSIKIISRLGSGISNIDLKVAKKLKIKVLSTPDAPTEAVAELTVGMMIALLRNIVNSNNDLKKEKWNRSFGGLLKNKKILIIGYGKIGKKVHHHLKNFNADIFIYDPFKNLKSISISKNLNSLLSKVDIISCHASGNQEILGEQQFKKIKKGTILLNSSRGSIVSEKQIINAIQNKTLSFAWIDVFNSEPYRGKMTKLKNIILTPHISSYTVETRIKMENDAVMNLINNL